MEIFGIIMVEALVFGTLFVLFYDRYVFPPPNKAFGPKDRPVTPRPKDKVKTMTLRYEIKEITPERKLDGYLIGVIYTEVYNPILGEDETCIAYEWMRWYEAGEFYEDLPAGWYDDACNKYTPTHELVYEPKSIDEAENILCAEPWSWA